MQAQEPLVAGADQLDAAGRALPGFAGITVEPETCTIRVYWHGAPPSAVTAVAERLRPDVNVVVHGAAPYPHTELAAVAANLFDVPNAGEYLGVAVTRVSVRPQGTHVDVGVWPLPSSPGLDPQRAAAAAQAAWGPYLPVRVTAEPPAEPMSSRWDDRSPWWAGGQHRVGELEKGCTVGWPMRKGDREYLLTAAHCAEFPENTTIWNGHHTRVIGLTAGYDTTLETALIEIPALDAVGTRMWDGGVSDVLPPRWVNDEVEFSRPIINWTGTYEGMYVCTSGAATGAHCNIKVDDADLSYRSHNHWEVKHSAAGQQLDGGVAVGDGDSGGPLYSLVRDDKVVVAVGLMAQADSAKHVPCGNHLSTQCSSRVFFTKLGAIRTRWGLTNVTA
jgi:hypothetical protein